MIPQPPQPSELLPDTVPNPNDPGHPIHPHVSHPSQDHNPSYHHQDLLHPQNEHPFSFSQSETHSVPNPNAPNQPLEFDRFGHHGHTIQTENPKDKEEAVHLESRKVLSEEPIEEKKVEEGRVGSPLEKRTHSRKPTGTSLTFSNSNPEQLEKETKTAKRPSHSRSTSQTHFELAHRRRGSRNDSQPISSSSSSVSDNDDNGGHYINEEMPLKWAHLFKRPVVRQWLYQGKLYYEPTDRGMSKFELFFDLAFVGVIHQLAEAAAESATGLNILKFILVFYPAWSVWSDARTFINISGTDDLIQRTYILAIMILLLGYSSNASGIRFTGQEEGESEGEAVAHILSALLRRQEGGEGEDEGTVVGDPVEAELSSFSLTHDSHYAIAAAASYHLISKFIRITLYLYYGWALPNFRYTHFFNALSMFLVSIFYIPVVVHTLPTGWVIGLTAGAIILEITLRYAVGMGMEGLKELWTKGHERWVKDHSKTEKPDITTKRRIFHNLRGKTAEWFEFYPALNLAHFMERMAMFVVLVLGETIINITYIAQARQIGPHSEFQRSTCGLIIGFSLAWLYFDADSSRVFIHALRRNVFTSITYGHIHFPLCASFILMSAAMVRLVQSSEASDAIRWYFGGGIATAMICIALIGWLHRDLDKRRSSLIPRHLRLLFRVGVAIYFALIPLAKSSTLNNSNLLAISSGILVGLILVETAGKIGAVGDVEKQRLIHQGKMDPSHGGASIEDDFVELTEAERGEDDVGVEGDLGEIEMKRVTRQQAKAYASW